MTTASRGDLPIIQATMDLIQWFVPLLNLMITSTKGSPNNIIHPTRAKNTGFGKENFGRLMISVGRDRLAKELTRPVVSPLTDSSQLAC
jgi:hypothetical protein